MSSVSTGLECAQCGRAAPSDERQLARWRHGELAFDDELDEVAAALVLCPECDAEDRRGDYDPGEAG